MLVHWPLHSRLSTASFPSRFTPGEPACDRFMPNNSVTPCVGTTKHIPSIKNSDVPPGTPGVCQPKFTCRGLSRCHSHSHLVAETGRSWPWLVAERNNLVNEGTATWSGAPDIGEPTLTARSSQNWASSYKLEHNDAVFPDKHWEEIKHAKPEPAKVFARGARSPMQQKSLGIGLPLAAAGLEGGAGFTVGEGAEEAASTCRGKQPARPLTSRERTGDFLGSIQPDKIKRVLGIPEVPHISGCQKFVPQRKAGDYTVGLSNINAYGSLTARDSVRTQSQELAASYLRGPRISYPAAKLEGIGRDLSVSTVLDASLGETSGPMAEPLAQENQAAQADKSEPHAFERGSTPIVGYSGCIVRGLETAPGITYTAKMHSSRALSPHDGTGSSLPPPPSGGSACRAAPVLHKTRNVRSYNTTPAHLLHKKLMHSRVVNVDQQKGDVVYGIFPVVDSFLCDFSHVLHGV